MADTGQELIEAALAAVEDRIQAQIEQARQRRERERQQRQDRNLRRSHGVAKRHAARLRHQADRREDPPEESALTSQVLMRASEKGDGDGRTTG